VISPADVFCLAIATGLMFLEAHRGVVPALVDFLGILAGLVLTRWLYVRLSDHMLPSAAYMLLFAGCMLLIAIISLVITRRLQIRVTEVEAAIAAGLGLGTALMISYALFEWLSIRYGAGDPLVSNSLLNWAMSENAAIREIGEFFGHFVGK